MSNSFLDARSFPGSHSRPTTPSPIPHQSRPQTVFVPSRRISRRHSFDEAEDILRHTTSCQELRFSLSLPAAERIPMTSFAPQASPVSRPTSAPLSRPTNRHSQPVPRRRVFYMDCPKPNRELYWVNPRMLNHRSFSSDVPRSPNRRAASYIRQPILNFPVIRRGAGEIPDCTKVGYYGPDRIERKQDPCSTNDDHPTATRVGDLCTATMPSPPRAYDAVLFDYPRASIDSQISPRSWLEKEELMEEPKTRRPTFVRGSLSCALSAVFGACRTA